MKFFNTLFLLLFVSIAISQHILPGANTVICTYQDGRDSASYMQQVENLLIDLKIFPDYVNKERGVIVTQYVRSAKNLYGKINLRYTFEFLGNRVVAYGIMDKKANSLFFGEWSSAFSRDQEKVYDSNAPAINKSFRSVYDLVESFGCKVLYTSIIE